MQTDKFQDMVETCAENISKKIYQDKKLIIVHFVAGPKSFPYEIRRSEIRLKSSLFNDIYEKYNPTRPETDQIKFHNRALKNYIQYYARHNTFLTLVVRAFAEWYHNKAKITEMLFHCMETKSIPNEIYKIGDENDKGYTWFINHDIFKELIPSDLASKFWEFFYTIHKDEDLDSPLALYWMDRLEFLRALTLFRLLQKSEGKETTMDVIDYGLNTKLIQEQENYRKVHSNITSFQSMGIFMRGLKTGNDAMMGTSAIVKSIDPYQDEHMALVVVMVSPPTKDKIQDVYEAIERSFNKYNEYLKEVQMDTVAEKVDDIIEDEIDKEYKKIKDKYKEDVTSIFSSPIQKYNAVIYCNWILLLINKLSNKVHEGRKLNFYFICGDKSEFEDDGNIDYQPFGPDDTNILSIPKYSQDRKQKIDAKLLNNVIAIATSFLSKEHFPWFEEGKYALLWDVSSNERRPCGLIKINNSSWELYLKDRFIGNSKIAIPNCIIGCIIGEPQTTSIILVKKIKINVDNQIIESGKVEESYRWENNRLVDLANDKRIIELEKTLFEYLKDSYGLREGTESVLEEIKKYIKWIANDPNRGSILVFLKTGEKNPFRLMGIPWDFVESKKGYSEKGALEDRIALMSHDGATVVSIAGDKIEYQYRNLLDSDEISAAVKNDLIEESLKREVEDKERNTVIMDGVFPLSCVGTRRWSAALAAFKKEVLGVVVISQDGDIHYWKASIKEKKNGDGGLRDYDTEVYCFSNAKECTKHYYEYSDKEGEFKKLIL